ncbi:MAG: hypothetical protein C0598_12440 [Marinilabiliales bacterium]|nr:MAG: hypothetical protein C0598_12440 [Marinilabiliales bacterium]
MDEKVNTKGYEDYLKIVNNTDTLDIRQKEYILEQSKEMIIKAGIAEKEMASIGLKRDTSELQTFGEFFSEEANMWKYRNELLKKQMQANIIIDTSDLQVIVRKSHVEMGEIENKELSYVKIKKYPYKKYYWCIDYNIKTEGSAIVNHNIKNLDGFALNDLYDNWFTKVYDSLYEFTVTANKYTCYHESDREKENISYYDWKKYYEKNYFPDYIVKRRAKKEIQKLEERLDRLNKVSFKLNKISLNGNSPLGTEIIDSEFLSDAEYKEWKSIGIIKNDSATIKKLMIKYGVKN